MRGTRTANIYVRIYISTCTSEESRVAHAQRQPRPDALRLDPDVSAHLDVLEEHVAVAEGRKRLREKKRKEEKKQEKESKRKERKGKQKKEKRKGKKGRGKKKGNEGKRRN